MNRSYPISLRDVDTDSCMKDASTQLVVATHQAASVDVFTRTPVQQLRALDLLNDSPLSALSTLSSSPQNTPNKTKKKLSVPSHRAYILLPPLPPTRKREDYKPISTYVSFEATPSSSRLRKSAQKRKRPVLPSDAESEEWRPYSAKTPGKGKKTRLREPSPVVSPLSPDVPSSRTTQKEPIALDSSSDEEALSRRKFARERSTKAIMPSASQASTPIRRTTPHTDVEPLETQQQSAEAPITHEQDTLNSSPAIILSDDIHIPPMQLASLGSDGFDPIERFCPYLPLTVVLDSVTSWEIPAAVVSNSCRHVSKQAEPAASAQQPQPPDTSMQVDATAPGPDAAEPSAPGPAASLSPARSHDSNAMQVDTSLSEDVTMYDASASAPAPISYPMAFSAQTLAHSPAQAQGASGYSAGSQEGFVCSFDRGCVLPQGSSHGVPFE